MQTIILAEHGILPGADCTSALFSLTEAHKTDTTFVFGEGDYYFHSRMEHPYSLSNTEPLPTRKLGIWLREAKNVHIVGQGTRLWFSGQMQPITLDRCEGCSVSGLTINWQKPMVAEGKVTDFTETTVDVSIDPAVFPHRMTDDGWLEFDTGNDEWYPLSRGSMLQYDAATRTIRTNTGDRFSPAAPIQPLGNNTYRFTGRNAKYPVDTQVGNLFVLRHNERYHAGIFAEKCMNLSISDITVHSCGGLGCLVQFCRDVRFKRVHFVPDERAGRYITSGRDDGMQITCCSGRVSVEECTFLGLMDDPINIHGCCVVAQEFVDALTIRCRFMHPQAKGFLYWAEQGDAISFIRRSTMETFASATVVAYALEDDETFLLTFSQELPKEILSLPPELLSLDNITHTASFSCIGNRFGSCRARGILISTPKPVRIAENLFESSGSAILVAGDSNYWFESGACHDVEISHNTFTKTCLSSMYQFTEGMISICPVVPEPSSATPYHRSVRIVGNVFDCPDTPVLYAFSTENVEFSGNKIYHAHGAKPWHSGKHLIKLKSCTHVSVSGNTAVGRFALDGITAEDCPDLRCTDWPK